MDQMGAAGYSGKPLVDKLGIKIDTNLAILNAPDNYDDLIGGWPVGSSISRDLSEPSYEFIHYFTTSRSQFVSDAADLKNHLEKGGMLWVSWPKQGSPLAGDLGEQVLRDTLLPQGLVDTKVCAVDDSWSALKFVWRKATK